MNPLFVFLDKKAYAEDMELFHIKSFHQDFNSDYKGLFDFLNSELQRIVKEKCCVTQNHKLEGG
jgi:hypothetical protein